jgi:diguanylate cyclase (GGDEF)-like protein
MWAIDVFSCYAVAGAGALVGLLLVGLIRATEPHVKRAVALYCWSFICQSVMLVAPFGPDHLHAELIKIQIGFSAMSVALLGWAFRELNGRHTATALGVPLTLVSGLFLWGMAFADPEHYQLAVTVTFFLLSTGLAVDQSILLLRPRQAINRSEVTLLVVAANFALSWLIALIHVLTVAGPYPAHWLHMPSWILPICSLAFALLPISVAAVVFSIINERLNQQLRAKALSDELTGALSRRGLRELGERMLAQQLSQPSGIAVLMIDADHFKRINDTHGHFVGDEVLRHLTATLRTNLREDALLARYGGEEFTVMLPVRHPDEAHIVADRLRELIANTPCQSRAGPIALTVSIGVSHHQIDSSLDDDLSRADLLLYRAKQTGRNKVVSSEAEV